MNIIHIVRGDYAPTALNGVYNVIHNISVGYNKTGKAKALVCSISNTNSVEIFKCEEYEHVQFSEHKLLFFLSSRFKEFLLAQPRDTVIHLHSVFIPWFLYTVKFLRRNGFNNIVLTPHGQYINEAMSLSLKKRLFFYFFDKHVIRNVNAVQIIGRTEANDYIKSNAKRYVLIPNGCNIAKSIERINDVDSSNLIFGYMGRLATLQKGLDILLKAFAFYRKQGGCGLLHIAGSGADEKYLKELCRQLSINDTVRFVGTKLGKEKSNFLLKCGFFIHTSRWDVVPTGCMEAAAYGIPLVVSSETNLDTYVDYYDAGISVSIAKHPVQKIADVLFKAERLFFEKNEYDKLSKNAQRMVDTELNWTHIAHRIIGKLYNNPTTHI